MKFYITKHAQSRYLERVYNNQNVSSHLLNTILADLYSAKNITGTIAYNVPRFILYLKERYGSDKGFNILKYKNVLFIATKRKGTTDLYDVVTCYIENNTFDMFKNTTLCRDEIHMRLSNLKYNT